MEPLDEKQSLQIITQMINTARNRLENNSFFFLLWGWSVLAASVLSYILIIMESEYNYLPWPVLMTLAAIVSAIYGRKQGKRQTTQSHLDRHIGILWMCTGGAIVLTLVLVTYTGGVRASYTTLMLLYGMSTLVTGIIIRFTPLIAGGIFVWCCAIAFTWIDFPEGLLINGLSVLGGYIIPGYLLRAKRERKQQPVLQ